LLVLLIILAGLAINQRIAISQVREQFPAPGKLIDVGGHLMHIHCIGSGSPIVVIDAGNGSFSVEWTPIQEQLSQETRVCTYDRAGYGWSEPGPEPRTGVQVVEELHTLLEAAGESGPYLLVGHSLGGVHVRLFAAQYPKESAGLVLVETAYPLTITPEYEQQIQSSIGFYQTMKLIIASGIMRILGPLGGEDSMPETARKLPADLQQPYLNLLLDPVQYTTAISEMGSLPQTFAETSSLLVGDRPFGDLPLIVLTAGQMAALGSTPFENQRMPVPEEQIERQLALAGMSTHGKQQISPHSGHLVHLDAPQDVIGAIQEVIAILRSP
jgi:pimeloyl-ACP methyl ester carboxylesterase